MCISQYKCPMSLHSMYWNIHGTNSKIIGNKLVDPEFLNKISNKDIVRHSELHTNDMISLPGFKLINQHFREKKHRGPKISGGLAVFVKDDLQHMVTEVITKNEDSIWIKIQRNKDETNDDIYIGTYYISPARKQCGNQDELLTNFNAEILRFKEKGQVIIQGYLNARTGQISDFISDDKYDDIFGIKNSDLQIIRNSEDTISNKRGRELLDFCKTNDFIIVNGRKSGDIFGKYTSHQWNGSSVVDYTITQNTKVNNIQDFSIGDYIPWLSDHCPINTTISFSSPKNITKTTTKLTAREQGFKWDPNIKNKFEEILVSEEMNNKINNLLDKKNPLDLVKTLKGIILETARKCKLSKTKPSLKKATQPWFDKECNDAKNAIRGIGKQLKKSPGDNEIRNSLFEQKKNLKKLTIKKKNSYKNSIINEMSQSTENNNPKKFWKLLNKLTNKKS